MNIGSLTWPLGSRAVRGFLFLVLLVAARTVGAQIPKTDFHGTWIMNHDGWEGTLVLRGAGTATGLFGDYVGSDKKAHFVQGTVDGHKVVLHVDMNDTKGLASDDQTFEGYLFTQSRTGMAGTTRWGGSVYGWSAVRKSADTSLPAPPLTSTDKPDPSGPTAASSTPVPAGQDPSDLPSVVGYSGEFRLSTTKEQYSLGEAVGFELKNTQHRTIDLTGFYFVIERRQDGKAKEFYTSPREPYGGLALRSGDTRLWYWDQWDNERTGRATPGRWRIRVFAPAALPEPFVVSFTIKAP